MVNKELILILLSVLALCQPSLAGKEKKKITVVSLFNVEDSAMNTATFLGVSQATKAFVLPNHKISYKPFLWETEQEFEEMLVKLAKKYDIIIGFERSSYVDRAISVLEENQLTDQVILISSGSTSVSLSLADNIFRVMPNDSVQARALAFKISDLGATGLASLCVDDSYGNSLVQGVIDEAKKDIIDPQNISDPVSYDPDTTNFSAHLATLEANVQALLAAGALPVVLYKGFEVADVFVQANDKAKYPGLNSVSWIGTDTTARSPSISGDAAIFASERAFVASDVAVYHAKSFNDVLIETLEKAYERSPTSTEAFAYDAGYLATMVSIMARRSKSVSVKKAVLQNIASTSFLIGGGGSVDQNGDRAHARYEFYVYTSEEGWLVDGETFPFFEVPIQDEDDSSVSKRDTQACQSTGNCRFRGKVTVDAPEPGRTSFIGIPPAARSNFYATGRVLISGGKGFVATLTENKFNAFPSSQCRQKVRGTDIVIKLRNNNAVADKENGIATFDKTLVDDLLLDDSSKTLDLDFLNLKDLERREAGSTQLSISVYLCN